MNEKIIFGIITNTCSCVLYNEETKYLQEATECEGLCWELSVEDFSYATESLRNNNPTDCWKVENIRLWNGDISGHFKAQAVTDLLRGMTVNSEWTMRYEAYADRIEYSLSHHDAPTGSVSVLRTVSEEEREELGLY